MKKFVRALSVGLIIALLSVSMAACTYDEITLMESLIKTSKITSCESDSKIKLTFKGEGFSGTTQKSLEFAEAYLNGFTMLLHQKLLTNEEKTKTKLAVDCDVNMQGLGIKAGYWMDADFTGEKVTMKQIVELPPPITQPFLLAMGLDSKNYFVFDYGTMLEEQELDLSLFNTFDKSTELQEMMFDFIRSNMESFNPGVTAVTKKGSGTTDKGESVTIYEIKLSDASAKKLMHAFINDVVLQESSADFMRKYMESIMDMYEFSAEEEEKAIAEMDEMIKQFVKELPTYRQSVTEAFESIKDVKFLGDEGIALEYCINKDGYVVGEKASIDVVINAADLQSAFGGYTSGETGTIRFGIDYETSTYNINKIDSVPFPVLTEDNSIDVLQHIKDAPVFQMPNVKIPSSNGSTASVVTVPVPVSDEISVYVNGRKVAFADVKPENINGRVLVPLRTISNELGAEVLYNEDTKQIDIIKGEKKIQLTLGAAEGRVDDEVLTLDAPPMVIEGRTMVPVRFISENMDAFIEWDEIAKSVHIYCFQ